MYIVYITVEYGILIIHLALLGGLLHDLLSFSCRSLRENSFRERGGMLCARIPGGMNVIQVCE